MQRHKTTKDPNEDNALFASTPEVTASSRSISDRITAQRKTRDQQIQDLQAIIDIYANRAITDHRRRFTSKQGACDRTGCPLSSTPSPNQNIPSPERPQDIAYKQALEPKRPPIPHSLTLRLRIRSSSSSSLVKS
jgi:hypothetical protein